MEAAGGLFEGGGGLEGVRGPPGEAAPGTAAVSTGGNRGLQRLPVGVVDCFPRALLHASLFTKTWRRRSPGPTESGSKYDGGIGGPPSRPMPWPVGCDRGFDRWASLRRVSGAGSERECLDECRWCWLRAAAVWSCVGSALSWCALFAVDGRIILVHGCGAWRQRW